MTKSTQEVAVIQPVEAIANCLTVHIADLGPADAAIDVDANVLVLSSRLDAAGRATAAKRALGAAGMEQSDGEPICLCGYPLQLR